MPSENTLFPHKKTVIATSLAIILEWYNFSIFGFFAVVISKLFFPFTSESASIIFTYVLFAVSFLFRPLGSVVIGYLGDRYGRKNAFILTLILITLPTVLIGLLPTYADIGVTATVLLIVLRIAQGLSVGGERSSTISLLAEIAPPGLRGVYSSLSLFSTTVGILLASAVCGYVSGAMSEDALYRWGWRIPFIFGLLTGVASLFLRRILVESTKFTELRQRGQVSSSPLVESIKNHWRAILTVLSATLMFAVSFYLIFIYVITFGAKIGGMPLSTVLNMTTINLAIITVMVPACGYLADKVGRKPVMIAGCAGMAVVSLFFFQIYATGTLSQKVFIQLSAGVMNLLFAGGLAAFMAECFPTRVRMSGISMGNVVSFSVFGGSAPLIAAYLVDKTGDVNSPGIYLLVCSLISLVTIVIVKETRGKSLE